jgi:hypothetical protein
MNLADKLHELYLNKKLLASDYYECLSLLADLLTEMKKQRQEEVS